VTLPWRALLRDIGIIFVLTFIGGLLMPFAPTAIKQNPYVGATVIILFGAMGFCIAGCLTKVDRFKYLGMVFLGTWFTGVINVIIGQPLSTWLASSVSVAYMAILGGGLSYFVAPTPVENQNY
jgi:hypothetical protein